MVIRVGCQSRLLKYFEVSIDTTILFCDNVSCTLLNIHLTITTRKSLNINPI